MKILLACVLTFLPSCSLLGGKLGPPSDEHLKADKTFAEYILPITHGYIIRDELASDVTRDVRMTAIAAWVLQLNASLQAAGLPLVTVNFPFPELQEPPQ